MHQTGDTVGEEGPGWHYMAEGVQVGPISQLELASALWHGAIPWTTTVWTDGMPQWAEAKSISALTSTRVSLPVPRRASAIGAGTGQSPQPLPGTHGDAARQPGQAAHAVKAVAWWKKALAISAAWIVIDVALAHLMSNTAPSEEAAAGISQLMGTALVWGLVAIWAAGSLNQRGLLRAPITLRGIQRQVAAYDAERAAGEPATGMAFSVPRPNLYVSDAGFEVEVLGRVGLRYSEGNQTVFVDSEVTAVKSPTMVVWKDGIMTWESPREGVTISDSERDRIIENIRLAFASQGDQIRIQ